MYGMCDSSDRTKTFALASFDLIALNAAKLAVPPPISKYGTCFGMLSGDGGNRTERD